MSTSDQRAPRMSTFNKVLIIGLGQLGLPVAKYVKERGFDVYGYDISPKAVERAVRTTGIKKADNFADFDVYILCISTHRPDDIFSPQIEGLLSIAERISREANSGTLVSIESTIPRGTSKKIFQILNHRLHVAHAPHRWYALEEKEHGVNQLRVIGGVCECCLDVAMEFYEGTQKQMPEDTPTGGLTLNASSVLSNSSSTASGLKRDLGIPMHAVSEVEIAEITKIVENAHRYLQIAFAEDLYLYCQSNNINFPELRDALNTKWNVHLLEPREGIGGHCLPKDTKMFIQSSKSIKSKILTAAIEVDQDYRRYRTARGGNITSGLDGTTATKNFDNTNNAESKSRYFDEQHQILTAPTDSRQASEPPLSSETDSARPVRRVHDDDS
ncbi:MAG TPA: NAD(P)-binding domain-containing protein [Nitrososphaeraceae archaeon]|nr:NAD(P)-binding domain-containing protein [Nitrososphaeraceae archaeon]